MCTPKDLGDLSIIDLRTQNQCLLSKWLYMIYNTNGLWQRLIHRKYLNNKTLSQVQPRIGDSHFWRGILKVKESFLRFGTFLVGDGSQIRF